MKRLLFTLLTCLALHSTIAQIRPDEFHFQQFSTPQGLPNGKVHRVLQDSDGFIWIGTYYGLFRYDGYDVKSVKSDYNNPNLLLHNEVLSLCEDKNKRLWIGTQSGLNMLDKVTGKIHSIELPGIDRQRVHDIIETSDGELYFGYIRGMYRYDASGDSLQSMSVSRYTGDLPEFANIQSFLEMPDGDLIISTWTQGLFRYDPKKHHFTHYELLSDENQAIRMQEMQLDAQGHLWLGTYGSGLYRIDFSADKQSIQTKRYHKESNLESDLESNYIMSLAKDPKGQNLWLGTRKGFSVMSFDSQGEPIFTNYAQNHAQNYFPEHDVNDIICDNHGLMWLATDDGGLYFTDPFKENQFSVFRFSEAGQVQSNNIKGLLVTSDHEIWANTGYGINYYKDGETLQPISGSVPHGIYYSKRQDLVLIPLRDRGLSICRDGKEIQRYMRDNCDFLPTNNVRCVHEDEDGNWWIGTFRGLGVRYSNGRSYMTTQEGESLNNLGSLGSEIIHIASDRRGSLWLSTADHGILRLTGFLNDPAKWVSLSYDTSNGKLPSGAAIFVNCDKDGRVWAGLEGSGLCLYDEMTDSFHSVHQQYGLPGDMVNTMKQDSLGNFWLGTNQGLACLTLNGKDLVNMRIYTESDGLPDNFFYPKSATYVGGRMYFGCSQGLVHFRPMESTLSQRDVNCCITDFKVNGISFNELEVEERDELFTQAPAYLQNINLPAAYDNFEIEFAALTYNLPLQNRYAYRLLGFSDEWRTAPATYRRAYFSNLSPGTYVFEVKGSNESGDWSPVRSLRITILPPWYMSWWAYILYIAIISALTWIIVNQIRNRMHLHNELKIKEMESQKVEELNHIKLQFFANITHELMTPLTIISASLDEMKVEDEATAAHSDLLSTMSINVQRLMRLLQQILEFRKAETGNLKLRVANGDIAMFVRHAVESFTPLIRHRQQHISCVCEDKVMMGYFDTDKMDKILYNLLSNAAKYTPEGGGILINLNYTNSGKTIKLVVKDTGRGMTEKQKKGLFKRFYEGDYRENHTIGNGIGLSLVHDLVELHRGTIEVESVVDQGSSFTIVLPIQAEAYDKEQITEIDPVKAIESKPQIKDVGVGLERRTEQEEEEEGIPSILLVEDNEELQEVMFRLLKRQYHVEQASNGKEALEIMREKEINLVVSDVIMPEMDGIELVRAIKSDIEICHIPVILLTAKRSEEDRDIGLDAGADAYLTKPFSLSALHARIQNLLRRREHAADDFKRQVAIDTSNLSYTDIDQDFMKRAIEVVNNHLSDPSFDVVQFATEMASSRSTLYKKLRSLTSLNPTGFVRNIRLKAACQIMEQNPNIRINELAYNIGFNDPKYFSICFKKEFGMQPSEFCNSVKNPQNPQVDEPEED